MKAEFSMNLDGLGAKNPVKQPAANATVEVAQRGQSLSEGHRPLESVVLVVPTLWKWLRGEEDSRLGAPPRTEHPVDDECHRAGAGGGPAVLGRHRSASGSSRSYAGMRADLFTGVTDWA